MPEVQPRVSSRTFVVLEVEGDGDGSISRMTQPSTNTATESWQGVAHVRRVCLVLSACSQLELPELHTITKLTGDSNFP